MSSITGKVIEVPFVNKVGCRIVGLESLFLETSDKRYYIKFRAGTIPRKDLESLIGETINVEGTTHFGTWDSDDPKVQSRVGDYIVIAKLLK